MEDLKTAIIGPDGKVKRPICSKCNGRVTGSEFVFNYKIRCRGSRRGNEHYFLLFTGDAENLKTINGGRA